MSSNGPRALEKSSRPVHELALEYIVGGLFGLMRANVCVDVVDLCYRCVQRIKSSGGCFIVHCLIAVLVAHHVNASFPSFVAVQFTRSAKELSLRSEGL